MCRMGRYIVMVGVILVVLLSGALADELLMDGGFDSVLEYWTVDSELEGWIPYDHTTGAISLDSPQIGYTGVIIRQPLNVAGVANKTVQVSLDVAGPDFGGLSTNNAVGVVLEYITTSGDRIAVQVLSTDNASIPDGSFATFSNPYVFPANADRLVEFQVLLTSADYGLLVDSASLTSSGGLVAGPLPVLSSITPSLVTYGETFTLNGSGFGTGEDVVRIDGKTNGVNILSWTDNAIELTVDSTSEDGMVDVEVGGTHILRQREMGIISPHYRVDAKSSQTIVLAGQQIEIDLFAEFQSGFSTTNGIVFSVPDYPGAATFTVNPLMQTGGTLLYFDTTGLSNGLNTIVITATETNLAPRKAEIELDVRQVASCSLDVDGSTFTAQNPVMAYFQVMDTLGNDITWELPKPIWSSYSPSQIDVFQEPSDWGNLYILPHATGSAVLQATLSDGSTTNFSVSAAIPASPSVLNHSFLYPVMSNDPTTDTNEYYFTVTEPMSYYSYSVSDLSDVGTPDSWWNGDNSAHTYLITIGPDNPPGEYLFQSFADTASGSVGDGCVLTVVNNPATGMIQGHIALFGDGMMQEASGMLKFYDAVSGAVLFTNDVWSSTADYTVPSVPPGSYKLCFVNDLQDEQWYPNATSNTASTVVVSAGATVGGINFAFNDSDEDIPDPDIVDPPSYDSGTGTFGFSIQTDSTENYHFMKSANLHEGSWYVLEDIWGDGSEVTVSDTNAQSSAAFYRVITE